MNLYRAIGWAIPLSLVSSLGAAAFASTIDLEVLPLTTQSNPQGSGCPATLRAYETPNPSQVGGFSTQGMIQLSAIATDISVAQSDKFSATWVGTLKAPISQLHRLSRHVYNRWEKLCRPLLPQSSDN